MTECEEIAVAMQEGYELYLGSLHLNTLDNATAYAAMHLDPEESYAVVDNVAQALYERLR